MDVAGHAHAAPCRICLSYVSVLYACLTCLPYVSQTVLLSTSNCGNPALRMFGFGPVQREGFGVGYIIKDDNVQFCVTSYNRQTARFINSLEDTLLTFRRVIMRNLGGMHGTPTPRACSDDGGTQSPIVSALSVNSTSTAHATLKPPALSSFSSHGPRRESSLTAFLGKDSASPRW